jgi:DNA processing protein
MKAPEEERLARAVLIRLSEPNDVALHAFVDVRGAPGALAAIQDSSASLPGLEHYRARLAGLTAGADLDAAALVGARLVVPGDLEWPSQLADLHLSAAPGLRSAAPPLGLWVRGPESLRMAALRSVAVVGSRAATSYGTRVSSDLGSGLADRGYAAVSGGAYGIDAATHRGVLAVGGVTVCVLASGVDVPYPMGHHALFDRIADEGLLVSELPPGSHPTKGRFLDRNRLIAALTRGTVVIEAAFRSGALNTTSWARRMNRPVLGTPGPVTSPLSAGVHRELREGRAELVTCAGDVVAAVGTMGEAFVEAEAEATRLESERKAATRPEDQLDAVAKRVLDAVPVRKARDRARLVQDSGLSADLVTQRLVQLRALGLVEEHDGGWRLAGGSARAVPNG